jgi:hypothetical protein
MKSMHEELRIHGTKMEEAETNMKANREVLKEMQAKMKDMMES